MQKIYKRKLQAWTCERKTQCSFLPFLSFWKDSPVQLLGNKLYHQIFKLQIIPSSNGRLNPFA
jgi:hypothetical protein